MYPPVTQFETRDVLVRQQLELLRIRQRAARRTDARPRSWRRALRLALLLSTRAHLPSLLAAALVAGVAASTAAAGPYSVSPPAAISGLGPFSSCTFGATRGGVVYTSSEVEPWLALDPVSGNLVAVWQQDRWSDGAARALGTAVSSDGGATRAGRSDEQSD
jgi:hypothetical protein